MMVGFPSGPGTGSFAPLGALEPTSGTDAVSILLGANQDPSSFWRFVKMDMLLMRIDNSDAPNSIHWHEE